MTVNKTRTGTALDVAIEGRIDTVTSPTLEEELKDLTGVTDLTLDFAGVAYISSAGLRVLLSLQKRMNTQGNMALKNVSGEITEIFDITGFSDILTIE